MRHWCTVLLLALAASLPSRGAHAELKALVIGGLGGTEEYAKAFESQAKTIGEALRSVASDDDAVRILPTGVDRDDVITAFDDLAGQPVDRLVVVLTGHASIDTRQWRFNLPGEDLTTSDLVAGLAGVTAPEQLVVLAAPASGALLDVLDQPGRLVITATKSGGEINAVRFGDAFAEALGSGKADIDRNEILTVAEAYRYANQQTRDYYETRNLLASEHARLRGDDADAFSLARLGALKAAGDDAAVATLLEQRLNLEQAFRQLKGEKSALEPDLYYRRLERLLIRIATLQVTIDRATGWSGDDTETGTDTDPAIDPDTDTDSAADTVVRDVADADN